MKPPPLYSISRSPPGMRIPALLLSFLLAATGATVARATDAPAALLGAWRLDDGRVLTLAPSAEGTWRYRHLRDGRSGRLHAAGDGWQGGPGFSDREPAALHVAVETSDRLRWTEAGAAPASATRIALREIEVEFRSGDALLTGRLVLPAGEGRYPMVVLVHGSERLAAVGQWHEPYLLAAHGMGAFVYDKRGTGRSQGRFSADFALLAGDAAAAARMLAERPEVDPRRIGFAGFSQGGWVAPLAAERFGGARAVMVAYGAVASPLAEDRWQCQQALRTAGGDATAAAQLERLVDSVHALLVTDLKGDWSAYKEAAREAKRAAWFPRIDAGRCIATSFAGYPAWAVRAFAGERLPPDIDWRHDSTAVLQKLDLPMLWLLAGEDSEAPTAQTAAALATLAQAGKPITTEVLAGAEHGMLLFRQEGDTRVSTGYHPDYFRRLIEFWQAQFAPG